MNRKEDFEAEKVALEADRISWAEKADYTAVSAAVWQRDLVEIRCLPCEQCWRRRLHDATSNPQFEDDLLSRSAA